MATTVLSSILPSLRRDRKLSGQEGHVSKLSARFGDVTISAPTAGAWNEYESSRSIDSYSTMPSLDRLLHTRTAAGARGEQTATPPESRVTRTMPSNMPVHSTVLPLATPLSQGLREFPSALVSQEPSRSASFTAVTAERCHPPRSRSARTSPATSPRGGPSCLPKPSDPRPEPSYIFHADNLGDIVVSPRFFTPEWQEQQLLEHQYRFQHGQTNPSPMRPVRHRQRASSNTIHGGSRNTRSASASPRERLTAQAEVVTVPLVLQQYQVSPRSITAMHSDDDADTVFDSEEEDMRSIHSQDSGFIFDDIDIGIVTPSSSSAGSPGLEACGISQGAYISGFAQRRKAKRATGIGPRNTTVGSCGESGNHVDRSELLNAVQDAERRRLDAERETENVKKLLAAVEAKKDLKARKKLGMSIWGGKDKDRRKDGAEKHPQTLATPVKVLVPDAEDIWG